MLFNSLPFIFLFLPIVLTTFLTLGRRGSTTWGLLVWLTAASLFFYGWWNIPYVLLLAGGVLFNFIIGHLLSSSRGRDRPVGARKAILALGITLDLLVLGYFKYANFFIENLNFLFGIHAGSLGILLPLGISFHTFQQIAYLVDAYREGTEPYPLLRYATFVCFFPQLIAGPIAYHKEVIPQFSKQEFRLPDPKNIAIGLTLFAIGLFKKVILADGVASYASPIFQAAADGSPLAMIQSWGGALGYTLQLYFDFSGYSDMAIGLARLFNVKLPLNFNSPYKATNIIEFWRRWHMTLSRFLRDYLYISLGGNRKGPWRRYLNLMITMLLGGLWHGAGWNFVIWGGLHGLYLTVNHAWRRLRKQIPGLGEKPSRAGRIVAWSLTFVSVVVGWVFFRAETLPAALTLIKGMMGFNGLGLPAGWIQTWLYDLGGLRHFLNALGLSSASYIPLPGLRATAWIAVLLFIALFSPNSQQILGAFEPALNLESRKSLSKMEQWIQWRPNIGWAFLIGTVSVLIVVNLANVSEFLYWQF